ncbi:hypothetical protein QE152_g36683 [Popillia japonica]|uniref:Uncharacterized protein n=1 Tax=Popillia japonica TaxID=7064 RepID=A0AAW1ICK3_POPJA
MSTSPIFRLYESQGDVSYTLTESPAKKKRKRDEIKNANAKVGGLSKELLEVQTFMLKLNNKTEELKTLVKESTKTKTEINNKTEELKTLVKESTKTKTEIKAATRELVNIVGIRPKN